MSSMKMIRSYTPLHIGGSVGTAAYNFEVRGKLADGSIVSGLAETLSLKNTHGSQTLSVSFNNSDWVDIAAGASRDFEYACRFFWVKGSGAGTTFTGLAGIRARYL
jgi:hypothetical protein